MALRVTHVATEAQYMIAYMPHWLISMKKKIIMEKNQLIVLFYEALFLYCFLTTDKSGGSFW